VNIVQMPEGHDVNSIVLQEGAGWLDERIRKCINER
jgi:DNA primase